MNASEARQKSEAVALKAKQEAEAKAAKAEVARIASEKTAREKFIKDFDTEVERYIGYAVEAGRTSTLISIGSSSQCSNTAQSEYDKHKYHDVIEKKVKSLEKEGYWAAVVQQCDSHTTMHESSVPDYDYYTYYMALKVSWA